MPQSTGPLRSAGVLAFGPENVLFVGDIAGSAVHAFALQEKDLTPQTDVELGNFHNFEGRDLVRGLDQKLAALFGTTYNQIVVNDLVVHQPSQQIFISVERGRGTDAVPAIVKVNHGNLELLELDSIPHSQVAIPNEPDEKAMLEFEPQQTYAITDVKYYKGEIFVTGVSNQRFASTLHRIPYPFRPENLLRFYVCFSNPMRRGRSEEQIRLLGPDGRPASDTLYRPPVELWDRSMRHLTILLDPGRLKRGVGPNRELGPPLKAGEKYTLAIGSGMIDSSGRSLSESFSKSFHVTEAVREPIAVEQWKILPPLMKGHQPLVLVFPKPLDWALLRHTITIASEDGQPIDGRIAIDQGERRWSFTPASPWTAGSYYVRIASSLEDVCGNSLLEAFDRPLRSARDLVYQAANRSLLFHLA